VKTRLGGAGFVVMRGVACGGEEEVARMLDGPSLAVG
jgi:hypothetical protein